jgi:hypothetical protein
LTSAAAAAPWAALAIGLGAGCAKVGSVPAGTGGSGTQTGGGRSGGGGGNSGQGGMGGRLIGNPDAGACQTVNYKFTPEIPTVFLLVDRSGSMFNCLSDPNPMQGRPCPNQNDVAWLPLRQGVLDVVMRLQAGVRFGFGAFTGVKDGTCPIFEPVAPKLDNYPDIMTRYTSLAPPRELMPGTWEKWETPTKASLERVGQLLAADTTPGGKYILFVTDGEPDYCGDGNPICAPDSVVAQLQKLKTAGITTIVFGIQSPFSTLPPGILQAFANAGAGETVAAPVPSNLTVEAIWDQCHNGSGNASDAETHWKAEFAASGKPDMRGQTLGTYTGTPGPTRPFTPTVTDRDQLINQLSQALAGVKSCSFDLGDVGGRSIRVNLNLLDLATVTIEGRNIPRSDTDGWTMASDTELQLTGSVCTDWRKPENDDIAFNFPCDLIVID